MPVFFQLLKREAIEHRNGMLLTPLIIAAMIALVLLVSSVSGTQMIRIELDDVDRAVAMEELQSELHGEMPKVKAALGIALHVLSMPLLVVSMIVAVFMLLGSLYDERAERSILFWKSMPVTDTSTVLSKLTTGALLIPLAAAIIGFALQLFTLAILSIFGSVNGLPIGLNVWSIAPLFQVWWSTIMLIVFGGLWAAPFLAWLLLASAWAPRTPFLFAFVPVAVIALLEGLFNKTTWFIEQVGNRLSGSGMLETLGERFDHMDDFDGLDLLDTPLHITLNDIATVLAMPQLWIGLVVAAGFTATAIYVRRTKTL
ncbi:MAG: hypothetical protein PVF65_05310 [Sphingomonadales bacterium]|jgi:ABC-2 type transport system permease protein